MVKIKTISVEFLKNAYLNNFEIDITPYFKGIEQIDLLEDPETGLLFYEPPVTGDSAFYEQLQKFDWYYMEDKWEYTQALKYIKPGMRVLELGSGKGAFLRKLKAKGVDYLGSEFNKKSLKIIADDGLNVTAKSAEELVSEGQKFDVILSFQVMEHVADPVHLFKYLVKMLNKNGLIITSVPNGDSFAKNDPNDILNMPPHHVVIFRENFFKKLAESMQAKNITILFEPLQRYHVEWYRALLSAKSASKIEMLLFRLLPKNLYRGHTMVSIMKF